MSSLTLRSLRLARRAAAAAPSCFPHQQSIISAHHKYDAVRRLNTPKPPSGYVSPFKEIFDRMENNGPTYLGTTDEIEEMEAELKRNERKLACGIPERALRYQGTSFGRTAAPPHVMPNEHRLVMTLPTSELPFGRGDPEYEVLREIVGPRRLNDKRGELRLSSNQFGSRIENKRHLQSMVDRIVLSCMRLGKELRAKEKDDGESTTSGSKGNKDKETAAA